jgi:hypothetical protein
MILAKLEWYDLGNRVSDQQWRDLLAMLKVQGTQLDTAYLHRWAAMLGVPICWSGRWPTPGSGSLADAVVARCPPQHPFSLNPIDPPVSRWDTVSYDHL